jgi:hypothetical protein
MISSPKSAAPWSSRARSFATFVLLVAPAVPACGADAGSPTPASSLVPAGGRGQTAPDGGTTPSGASAVLGAGSLNPKVDPSITFDWPVDNKNSMGKCQAGHYTGDFSGMYASPATFVGVPIPVTGNVDLRLNQSAEGEFFVIADGHVSGTADLLFPYDCELVGTLNCSTKKLENGALEHCTYTVGTTQYPFSGPLGADYNGANQSFENGAWSATEPNQPPSIGGAGTWSAHYAGP